MGNTVRQRFTRATLSTGRRYSGEEIARSAGSLYFTCRSRNAKGERRILQRRACQRSGWTQHIADSEVGERSPRRPADPEGFRVRELGSVSRCFEENFGGSAEITTRGACAPRNRAKRDYNGVVAHGSPLDASEIALLTIVPLEQHGPDL